MLEMASLIGCIRSLAVSTQSWLEGIGHIDDTAAQMDRMRQMFSRFDYYLCKRFFDIR